MTRRTAYLVVAAVAVVPRLVVLLHERGDILAAFTEKSDRFAQVLVDDGTFGFIAGRPSAFTQPLYSFFLAPIYWIVGREWWTVGFAQIAVAAATALLIYEIGRRFLSPRAGLLAALIATLNPYLVWHDVHVNREILDQLLLAAIVLLTLLVGERRGGLGTPALLGVVLGLAILGNSRLLLLPLVVAGYLLWRRKGWQTVGVTLAACAIALLPWLVRNQANVGCFTITTDSRALWKANNLDTYDTLAAGKFIDDVPNLPGAPPWPELAADLTLAGTPTTADECAQMRLYRREVLDFWRDHPGEKAKLMGQAARMLWDPRSIPAPRVARGGRLRRRRADVGAAAVHDPALTSSPSSASSWIPRRFAVLFVALLAYNTLAALVFAGSHALPGPVGLRARASRRAWRYSRGRPRPGPHSTDPKSRPVRASG